MQWDTTTGDVLFVAYSKDLRKGLRRVQKEEGRQAPLHILNAVNEPREERLVQLLTLRAARPPTPPLPRPARSLDSGKARAVVVPPTTQSVSVARRPVLCARRQAPPNLPQEVLHPSLIPQQLGALFLNPCLCPATRLGTCHPLCCQVARHNLVPIDQEQFRPCLPWSLLRARCLRQHLAEARLSAPDVARRLPRRTQPGCP